MRKRGWEGLPPPPVLAPRKPQPTGAGKGDPTTTFVVTVLGVPNTGTEPPPEPVTVPGTEACPASPATQSLSISTTTLSDFGIAYSSDEDSPINPAIADISDNNDSLIDPTDAALHETFYLGDGNVEVLCGNTLFRVHTGTLSFHSPVLRQMFTQANLVAAESPNGCPRILSSDTTTDFVTLLNIVYLPEYVAFPDSSELFH